MPILKADPKIVTNLANGSIEAFDDLYYQYRKAVFNNIYKFIQQEDIAEDILQEVFISLWENRSKMNADLDVAGWLFVVSYNKSLAFLKTRVKEKIVFAEDITALAIPETPQAESLQETHYSLLQEAVNALSPSKKNVFRLCRLQGKNQAEAARLLGLSPETVKGYMKESLKFIKDFILSRHPGPILIIIHFIRSFIS